MNGLVTRRLPVLLVLSVPAAALLGCGTHGSEAAGPSQPAVATAASPSPALSPSPATPASPAAPADAPAPDPSPDCIVNSDHSIDRVSLAVYFLECGGDRIPGSPDLKDVPVGCRIHFNATPRDGIGAPTCSRTWPIWQVGPTELLSGGGGETFTPAYTAQAPGQIAARCIVDGVRSDWLFLNLVER